MSKERKLFAGANTPDGFVGFYDKIADMYNLEKLYILKGGSGVGKSTFIRNFANAFPNEQKDFLLCSGDPKSLDGVILLGRKIGIIDGTFPHAVDPQYPGVVDEIVNLGEYIVWDKVKATREKLSNLCAQKRHSYALAYQHLNKAREIHHEIEALYKGAIDFEAMGLKLNQIIVQHTDNGI